MIVIGLTGSIGMGKSVAAHMLEYLGAKVCHADAIVHRLLGVDGGAVEAVQKAFPSCVKEGAVDRHLLGDIVFAKPEKRRVLENILHPLVVEEENRFLAHARQNGVQLAVLDIPLLYETGAQLRCDAVIVVTAPAFVQRQRVMKRAGMNEEKFRRICAAQMPDWEKRMRADFVVQTGLGRAYSFRQLKHVVEYLYA
jgi:dephospho-CoA kinase